MQGQKPRKAGEEVQSPKLEGSAGSSDSGAAREEIKEQSPGSDKGVLRYPSSNKDSSQLQPGRAGQSPRLVSLCLFAGYMRSCCTASLQLCTSTVP